MTISEKMAGGGLLAKNTLWNLLGQGLPILISIYTIPRLINRLGEDRFGILTLAWLTIGYLSLFDLGLGRALTKKVAELLGTDRESELAPISWTALILMLGLGIIGAVAAASMSHWLVFDRMKIPQNLQQETFIAFLLLSFAIPSVVVTSGLRGILEAKQEFGIVNGIRVPLGIFMFVGPLIACLIVKSLIVVIATLVVARFVAMIVHLWYCLKLLPALKTGIQWEPAVVKPLLAFGALMTVSNIISPIMVSMDRFLIAASISSKAVAYYATPFEMVTKLWIIPSAVVSVLFPVFSALCQQNKKETAGIFERSSKYVQLALFPLCLVIVCFSKEILTKWLGASFAAQGSTVMQWLTIGVFINGLGQVAFSAVQGIGRPDLTTKLQLIELPCYLLLVWVLMQKFGVAGVAAAWTLRVAADTLILTFMAHRLMQFKTSAFNILSFLAGMLSIAAFLSTLPVTLPLKIAGWMLSFILYSAIVWFRLLEEGERSWIQTKIARFAPTSSEKKWQSP